MNQQHPAEASAAGCPVRITESVGKVSASGRCAGLKSAPENCYGVIGVVCLFVCFQISLVEKYIEEKLLDRIPGFNMTAFTMSLQ